MKNIFKYTLKLILLCCFLSISSCEKDLYDDAIVRHNKGKVTYVSIDEVPFLIPSIEKYNEKYSFLNQSNKDGNETQSELLNLDLENILKYVSTDGKGTYSIVIKEEFEEFQNIYFKNLHIWQQEGEYKTAILKYDAINDNIKFDPLTFTGIVEILDIENVYQGEVQLLAGKLQCVKIPIGCWTVIIMSDGNLGVRNDCEGSSGGGSSSGNDGGGSNNSGDSGGSYPGSGGSYGGTPGSGGSNPGGTSPNGNDPTLVSHNPVVANVPVLPDPEETSTFNMARLLRIELDLSTTEQLWLRNSPTIAHESYSHLWDILYDGNPDNDNSEKTFIRNIIPRVMTNVEFTSIKPFIIEKQINGNQLDPCPQGVLNQVKNSTVCDIAQVISKLNISNSVYNTNVKSEVAPSGAPAQTVRNSIYNYTIYISTDYTGKTKLFIAASMFHELIHAYFMSLKDDYYNPSSPDLGAYNDFTYLFHYYVTLNAPSSINPADIHHQQMATDYVDAIARALQEYQTGIAVPSTSSPIQVYSDMAWGGLSDTPVFNSLFPSGSADRQRILNRYAAEQIGHAVGEGTPVSQTPMGQPCN